MIGSTDSNRREAQGSNREVVAERSVEQRHDRRNTNRQRGRVWAMSMLGNAKSKSQRKTHQVESGGTGRKFLHLTRGGLSRESGRGISRGHSSEDRPGNGEGAKGRRTTREPSTDLLCGDRREERRNTESVATAAATHCGSPERNGWILDPRRDASFKSPDRRKEVAEDAQ